MYDDSSNGFRSIIIPMSANHPSLLHAILAVAAFYRRQEDPAYHVQALEQKEKSLIHLRRSYPDKPEQRHEEMIATAIMLCVFEIKDGSGPNWDKHLHGGRSILRSRVNAQRRMHSISERRQFGVADGDCAMASYSPPQADLGATWSGGLSWWANKFFGYQSVNGSAATVSGAAASGAGAAAGVGAGSGDDGASDEAALRSPAFWLSQGLAVQEIDGFMGCSSELMAITAEMSQMAQRSSQSQVSSPPPIPEPGRRPPASASGLAAAGHDIERRLLGLWQVSPHAAPLVITESTNLDEAIEAGLSPPPPPPPPSDMFFAASPARARMLVLTAEARRQAALVFLHTCLRGLPVTHAAVQSRVSQALACVTAVTLLMREQDSPIWGMTPVIWPLFVAGAAALADEHRRKVLDAFAVLTSEKHLGVSLAVLPLRDLPPSQDLTVCVECRSCASRGDDRLEAARYCRFAPRRHLPASTVSAAK